MANDIERTPVPSELIYMVVKLDRESNESKPDEPWEHFYARRLLEHFLPVTAG